MPSVPTWSSPHPMAEETRQRLLAEGYEEQIFGSAATDLLLFSSPDQALMLHRRMGLDLESALLQFDQSCRDLINLKAQGATVRPCWHTRPPAIDAVLVALLLPWLEACPDRFKNYMELEPDYPYRLQSQQQPPAQLLEHWLSANLRAETLLEQHLLLQQQAQQLLLSLLNSRNDD